MKCLIFYSSSLGSSNGATAFPGVGAPLSKAGCAGKAASSTCSCILVCCVPSSSPVVFVVFTAAEAILNIT